MLLSPSFVIVFLFSTVTVRAFDDEFYEWWHFSQPKDAAESIEQDFDWNCFNDKSLSTIDRDFLGAFDRIVHKYGQSGDGPTGEEEENGHSDPKKNPLLAVQDEQQQQAQIGLVDTQIWRNGGTANDCSTFFGTSESHEQMTRNGCGEGILNQSSTEAHCDNGIMFQKMRKYYQLKETNAELCDSRLARILGISSRTLSRWKMINGRTTKLWDNKRKQPPSTAEEKLQKVRKYFQLRERCPRLREFEYAQMLDLSERTLSRWKAQFEQLV